MYGDNIVKKLLSNTIFVFVIIVILMLVATYLSFRKIETYKFLIVINVISSIVIFILLSVNEYYKSSTGYEILHDEKIGGLGDQKIKYFNNIFDNTTPLTTGGSAPGSYNPTPILPTNFGGNNSTALAGGSTEVMDDVDQKIEEIIKELQ